jgi:hypothetical protein
VTTPTPTDGGPERVDSGGPTTSEPVVISHAITTILFAAAGAGWLTVPDTTIDTIGTIAAVVLSTIGAFAARAKVSPTGRITWASVRDELQSLLYDEIDRLLALAPTAAAAGATASVEATQALPPVSVPAAAEAAAQGPLAPADTPVGTFTTTAPFGPASAVPLDPPTDAHPVITPAAAAAPAASPTAPTQ